MIIGFMIAMLTTSNSINLNHLLFIPKKS